MNKFVLKLLLGVIVISAFMMNKLRNAHYFYKICRLREDKNLK